MPTKKSNTVKIDFGNNLKISYALTDWGLRRYHELLKSGIPEQQAIAQVTNELKQLGLH